MIPGTDILNPANGFPGRLRACLVPSCSTVFVCSDPDHPAVTDFFAEAVKESFKKADFRFSSFTVLDRRNQEYAAELIKDAGLIILAGGHVPTQNQFFHEIGLKDLVSGYDGVIIGISAGSMNCAETVYAHPELDGEAIDPAFQRFLPGLGLTKKMLLPHYQTLKGETLDGLRVLEDIAYPDSRGRSFYLLPDGSFLYVSDEKEALCGEAYLLTDEKLSQISEIGKSILI